MPLCEPRRELGQPLLPVSGLWRGCSDGRLSAADLGDIMTLAPMASRKNSLVSLESGPPSNTVVWASHTCEHSSSRGTGLGAHRQLDPWRNQY